MESSCQSGCRHDPSSFYPEQPGLLTRERKLSDQLTNQPMAQILLEAWDHSPPLRHGARTHSRPRRWSHPRSEVFFNVWLAVGPSLVGSIVFLIGRDTRVSLTFRKTLAGPCSCPFPEFCSRTKYSRLKSQTKNQIDQTISPKFNQPL